MPELVNNHVKTARISSKSSFGMVSSLAALKITNPVYESRRAEGVMLPTVKLGSSVNV